MLPWLVLHRRCFPKGQQPWCDPNTQELMGEFMAGSSHFPAHLQATQITLDKKPSFQSQLPCYICSSFPIQLHTKPATSEQSSVTLLSSLLFHIPHWYQKYLECILTSSVVPLYAARCPFTLYPVKGDGKLPTFPNPLLSQQDSWVRHGSDNSLRYTDISQSRYYCQNPKGFKN